MGGRLAYGSLDCKRLPFLDVYCQTLIFPPPRTGLPVPSLNTAQALLYTSFLSGRIRYICEFIEINITLIQLCEVSWKSLEVVSFIHFDWCPKKVWKRNTSTLQVYSHCYQRNSWNSKYSQTHQKVVQCCKLKFQITPTKRCYPENFSLQQQDWLETFCWSQKNCLNRNEEIAKSCITIYGVYFYDRMLSDTGGKVSCQFG